MKEGVSLKTKKWRTGAILLAVVILVGAAAGISFAGGDEVNGTMEDLYQNFISKLAANLGLDQSIITTALETTKQQMLDEAVQEGRTTQEQADKISSSPNACLFGGFGFPNIVNPALQSGGFLYSISAF